MNAAEQETVTAVADLLRKASPDDPLQEIAWADCLRWAAADADTLDAFLRETGTMLPASPFEQMIDEATGHDGQIVIRFVGWFNENIWGSK